MTDNIIKYTDYVLQEHFSEGNAGHHYDLRIKYLNRGKLASWALPAAKLPSKPGNAVLAVRSVDHKKSWLKFYGRIPQGIGKGNVNLLENGIIEVHRWLEDFIITFESTGKILNGKFSLVRSKQYDGKKQKAWLLVRAKS